MATITGAPLPKAKRRVFQYDLLVRARQRELLRAAEMAQLRRIATDARRSHPTRPEEKVEIVGRRP
jgi:hypothetical protein